MILGISSDSFLDPLKPSGNYVTAVLTICNATFCIYGLCVVHNVNRDYFVNNINQLIFVMVKCGVLFEVRAEFLNII
jgi:hypothetical protein